ncbi:MAG: hypothetical protein IJ678_09510, partial [Kiritimatiellae bacterium]|nr:hypothetical protein [Kiritimatiellia bacterium]
MRKTVAVPFFRGDGIRFRHCFGGEAGRNGVGDGGGFGRDGGLRFFGFGGDCGALLFVDVLAFGGGGECRVPRVELFGRDGRGLRAVRFVVLQARVVEFPAVFGAVPCRFRAFGADERAFGRAVGFPFEIGLVLLLQHLQPFGGAGGVARVEVRVVEAAGDGFVLLGGERVEARLRRAGFDHALAVGAAPPRRDAGDVAVVGVEALAQPQVRSEAEVGEVRGGARHGAFECGEAFALEPVAQFLLFLVFAPRFEDVFGRLGQHFDAFLPRLRRDDRARGPFGAFAARALPFARAEG